MNNLIPVVLGALIAALAGLFGAWLQSRREHRQWLRERRFDAYTALDEVLTRTEVLGWPAQGGDPDEAAKFAQAVREMTSGDLPPLIARVNLLGPDSVLAAKDEYLSALENPEDQDSLTIASTTFINAMRRALKIPVVLWWR